jgi:hypothetical protein
MYWYCFDEVYQILEDTNFKIVAFASDAQMKEKRMLTSLNYWQKEPMEGMLYFVCEKSV